MVLCGGLETAAKEVKSPKQLGIASAIILITDESQRSPANDAKNEGYSSSFSNCTDASMLYGVPIVLRRSDKPLPRYLSELGVKVVQFRPYNPGSGGSISN